jgi:electron transfer flavoprotein beta subunit
MKILVCVKQVPDQESVGMTATSADWRPADGEGHMSRYDAYALEAALRLREAGKVDRIDALTVGAAGVDPVLRRAIGMGADHGVHICMEHPPLPSPFTIGGLIAAHARQNHYALILCGAVSEDLMQGLVGPIIAGRLGRPCLTAVHGLALMPEGRRLQCEREIEGGRHQTLVLDLPGVVTIQSGPCIPRYPSLSNLLRANAYPLETLAAEALPQVDARQRCVEVRLPAATRRGVVLAGTAAEKADALAAWLRDQGVC